MTKTKQTKSTTGPEKRICPLCDIPATSFNPCNVCGWIAARGKFEETSHE